MHLGEIVTLTAERTPDKTAIIFRDQPTTYRELDERCNQVANGLLALGVSKGDRVGLYMHNLPLFMEAFYGAQRIGASIVPLNPLYKPAEIVYILNDCGAKVAISVALFASSLMAAKPEIATLQHVIVASPDPIAGAMSWRDAFGNASKAPPPHADINPDTDVAVICYTSGTTGRPKGAQLSHRNFISNCTQMNNAKRVQLNSEDIVWVGLPLFHIYAMNVAMNVAVIVGATMVLMERFDPAAALAMVQKYHITAIHGAPPMYIGWANLPNAKEYDLSSLRYCGSGAAALPVQVLENFKAATGIEISEGYGLTEAAPVVTTNAAGLISKPGSIGPVAPGVEVRLIDTEGKEVPVGEIGELICRGSNIMLGYYNQPEATSQSLQDGWLHTGDLATVDADGYYYIVDRLKDMIVVSGYNVYPREVEELLFRHPAVADAAVVQAPDGYQGESVFAFVVLKPGETATDSEIIEYCRANIAVFKAPKRVVFRDSLPKNNTGKVLRRELRDDARQIVTQV